MLFDSVVLAGIIEIVMWGLFLFLLTVMIIVSAVTLYKMYYSEIKIKLDASPEVIEMIRSTRNGDQKLKKLGLE